MSSSLDLHELSIEEALPHVHLIDRKNAFLAGSRAVEVYVGHAALRAARVSFGVESSGDIDLVVSKVDYKNLKELGARTIRNSFPRPSHPGEVYTLNSLTMADDAVDIWSERWYEAARYPEGVIGVEELVANSEWNEELGVHVLTKSYLIDQRKRSVAFLGEKEAAGTITEKERIRLKKDQVDLSLLLPEGPDEYDLAA